MVPHPTAQYGQVERVSLARAILSVRNCAYAGFKSNPNTAAAAPPIAVSLKKSRRVGFILGLPTARGNVRVGCASRNLCNRTCQHACQAVISENSQGFRGLKLHASIDSSRASKPTCNGALIRKPPKLDVARYNSLPESLGLAGGEIFGLVHP